MDIVNIKVRLQNAGCRAMKKEAGHRSHTWLLGDTSHQPHEIIAGDHEPLDLKHNDSQHRSDSDGDKTQNRETALSA